MQIGAPGGAGARRAAGARGNCCALAPKPAAALGGKNDCRQFPGEDEEGGVRQRYVAAGQNSWYFSAPLIFVWFLYIFLAKGL